MKRTLLTLCGAAALVLLTALDAHARCGDAPGDATAIADARAEILATCGCPTTAGSRASYLSCARGLAANRVTAGRLSSSCRASVLR